jgi:hypothetical protein
MYPLRVRRADTKQLLSLLLVLAIWANYFCLTGYARVSPADPPEARVSAPKGGPTADTAEDDSAAALPGDGADVQDGRARVSETFGKLPLRFEVNEGQSDSRVRFLSRGGGYNIFLTPSEAVIVLSRRAGAKAKRGGEPSARRQAAGESTVLRMSLVGANAGPKIVGVDELPGKSNYFIGDDPSRWQTGVAGYGGVKYEQVYPGVDLVYYGNQRLLEHDFVVAPGADPRAIKLRFGGARSLRTDRQGDLLVGVKGGELRQSRPVAYQLVEGRREEVAARYVLKGGGQVSFEVGDYDTSRPLVIDPVLLYSTYLGGTGSDSAAAVAVDSAGSAYVVGATASTNFPTASAMRATNAGASDVFVTKLAPDGRTLVYSTYIGGTSDDGGTAIVVDATGNAYITGGTASSGFPTVTPIQSRGGNQDAFVAKLNASGSALLYSTYLGGRADDSGGGIAIDSAGSAYVTGLTSATNFPLLGAIQTTNKGAADVFVTKLNPAGTALVYSTYLGGVNQDEGIDIAVDSSGNALLTGTTFSPDYPTANAFRQRAGGWEAFVTKLNAAGNGLVYSTYVGGATITDIFDFGEDGKGITVDSAGNAYVTGSCDTYDFPTVNARQPSNGGGFTDAWVGKFTPTGSPVFITFLGGNGSDDGEDIALDPSGNIFVTGVTATSGGFSSFPTANPIQSSNAGSNDGFVTKMTNDGLTLLYSTYVGGTDSDLPRGIAVDAGGNAYVAGSTSSTNFPTANAFQAASGTPDDAFVLKITNQSGYTISGRVTDDTGAGVAAAPVSLTGSQSSVAQTDANGNYSFGNLPAGGSYTLTPSKAAFTFVPASRSFSVLSADQTANFVIQIFRITGRVTDAAGAGMTSVTVTLSGAQSATAQTDSNGNYAFANLPVGNYTVTPSKTDPLLTYAFTPPSRSYTNMSSSQVADFTAAAFTQSTLYPVADAYVQDGTSANANFGTATSLGVRTDSAANTGNNRDAYLRFDLTAVPNNITSAKLRVYASLSTAGSAATSAYSVSSTNWVESGTGGITWNNKPARSSTALTGATATVNSTTLAAYDIDVTAYVKGEKSAGRDLVSLALHNPTATTINTTLNSREATANKPQLLVTTSTSNASPTVSLTSPANGSSFTAPANITVAATAADGDGSVSKVEFFAGTTLIGTATTSPYQITWPSVAVGSYQLTAVATDNLGATTRSGAVTVNVNPPNGLPSVSMASPVDGASFAAGSSLAVSANASDGDGTVSKVEFFAGATLVGTATSPTSGSLYSITWANVGPGSYALTAKATDNAGGSTTSAAVNISVVSQTGLSPTADAYVKDGTSATANFGTATDLQAQVSSTAGNNREAYIKYDLTSVSGITRAKVRLYGRLNDTSASNVNAAIYSVANTTWTETGITWNTKQPSGVSPLATATVTNNVAQWYEWDVTSYVKAEKAAGRNVVSFVVKGASNAATFVTFNSREATTNRPQLVLRTTQARNALLVASSATLGAGDAAVRTRLQNLGFTVTVLAATKATSVTGAEADGKSLVLISSTITATNVAAKFRNSVVPVVTWEFDLLDDMGMTGTVSGTDFGTSSTTQTQLAIANASHPLAAGLAAGNASVAGTATTFTWGKPNANAARVATLTTDATKFVIFGYDAGVAMPGLEAPARRVALFMTDTTAGSFTAGGNSLFDAAIRWAVETNTAPIINSLTPTSGPSGTSVTVRGVNFGATQGGSTLTFNGFVATPTSWSDGAVVAPVPQFATTGPVVVTAGGVASNGLVFAVGETDTDGDGLPDNWELQYFGNLAQGAGGDPDGDGVTNLQEYQQGRNPTKSALADTGDFVNLKVHTPLRP